MDTIIASQTSNNNEEHESNQRKAETTKIAYYTRVGKYRPNQSRPISVTFQNREDKDYIMSNKTKLPAGLYVNHEYPPHVKRTRDRLRPLLRYVKTILSLRDKSRLDEDCLVINGTRYGL